MMEVEYALYSNVGGRTENEDSADTWKKPLSGKHCFLVADGLGGHGGGKAASSGAIECIRKNWSGNVSAAEWERLAGLAHDCVLEKQTASCKMKTTLVGLMFNRKHAAWVHVGDSRMYHFVNGELVFQTRDHSASQLAVMLGEIKPEEIRFHEARNRVLRALGQSGELKPEAAEADIEEGEHAFLLCTDGFWEYVTEKEMTGTLNDSETALQWLKKMRRILKRRVKGEYDNNTAIAIFLKK